jgi:hypothetical protein
MNKQIQELRGQVKLDIDQYQESLLKLGAFVLADDGGNEVLNAYLAKFAELIVRECALQCNHNDDMDRILEHFGVERCTT